MKKPLIHEIALAGFLILTSVRLISVHGLFDHTALSFVALFAVSAAVYQWSPWHPRLVYCAVIVQALFYLIRRAVDALRVPLIDARLEQADFALFGFNPNLTLEPFSPAPLMDMLSLCYLLAFLPYIAVAFYSYYRGELETLQRFCAGLFTVYTLGFLGYTLWPAVGPYASMADRFAGPLSGSWLTTAHHAFVVRGTNGIDAFPSLHCALTGFVLAFDRRHSPFRFRLMLLPVALLWIATVFLRYHFVVDIAAGFALAAAGLAAASVRPTESPAAT